MKNYIYPYRQKDFDTFQQTKFKSDKKLSVTECDNAVIVPHEFKFENNQQSTHLGGVIDKNNKYIPESAWYRWITPSDRDTFETSDTYQNADFIDETVVYGGYFYNHWGHFLAEMVGRLWYYIENSCFDRNIKIALAVKNEFRLHDNFK